MFNFQLNYRGEKEYLAGAGEGYSSGTDSSPHGCHNNIMYGPWAFLDDIE